MYLQENEQELPSKVLSILVEGKCHCEYKVYAIESKLLVQATYIPFK